MSRLRYFAASAWPHVVSRYVGLRLGRPRGFADIDRELSILARMAERSRLRASWWGPAIELEWEGLHLALRKSTSDVRVFAQVFLEEEYGAVVQALRSRGGEPQVVVDAGANIGLATLFLRRSFPGAEYHLIEPDPGNARQAAWHLEHNGVTRFTIEEAALWPTPARLETHRGFRDGKEWSIQVRPAASGPIQGITLDQVLERIGRPIDLLKLDIEGGERALFAEGDFPENALRRIRHIAIELHDEAVDRAAMLGRFAQAGFEASELGGELTFLENRR